MRERDRRRLGKVWARRPVAELAAEFQVSEAAVRREARRQGLVPPGEAAEAGPGPARGSWRTAGLLVLLALGVFANNLPNGFVYDDRPAVVDNPAAADLSQTGRIFTTASWWPAGLDAQHYRPLTTLTYALNGSLTPGQPGGYHLVNNLLHGLVAVVLYAVLLESGLSGAVAGLASVLFVVHPLHVEAVSWVNGRADVLAGLGVLVALLGHLRGRRTGGWGWQALAGVGFVAAGLAKETGYLTPAVLLAWDLCLGEGTGWRERLRRAWREGWRVYLACAVGLVGFGWVRSRLVGGALVATVTPMASPLAGGATAVERLFTGSYVLGRYLWLSLWPGPLSVDYSPDQIPRLETLFDLRTLFGLAVLAGWAGLLAVAVRRRRPAVAFWLLAGALLLLPASNLLFPIGTIMADRLVYLPLLAVLVPVAELWGGARRRWPRRAVALAVVGVLLLAGRTVVRNRDWRDEATLFAAAVHTSPRSAMAHKNLAAVRYDEGRYDEAARLASAALEILPAFPDAWLVLGNCQFAQGDPAAAVESFERCLALRADHASAHTNLAAALFFRGDTAGAVRESELGLAADPAQPTGWYNRVHYLVAAGQLAAAQATLDEAVRRDPDSDQRAEAEERLRQGVREAVANP